MVRFLPFQRVEDGFLLRVDQFGLTYQVPNLGIVWMPKALADRIAAQRDQSHTIEVYVILFSDFASDGSAIWIVDSSFADE